MKCLIFGGTGAMGQHLVEILSNESNLLYITSRKEQTSSANVKFLKGNARDNTFLEKILSDEGHFDVIVDFMNYKTEEFRNRIDTLLAHTDQYLFLSSSRVYANTNGEAITEKSPRLLDIIKDKEYLQTDEYALTKARQENILLNHALRNWTIIRPYITYSSIRLQLGMYEKEQWLFRALNDKPIVFSKDVAQRITTIAFGRDVSLLISKLIGNRDAVGEIYHIAGTNPMRWNEILDLYLATIQRLTDKRPTVIYTEKAIVPDMQHYQYKYDRLYDRVFDSQKVINAVGGKCSFISPIDGLDQCLFEFLTDKRNFNYINWKTEAELDRIADSRTRIKDIPGKRDKLRYFLYRNVPAVAKVMNL